MTGAMIAAAVEEYLAERRALSHDQFGNSAAARLDDLIRFGAALGEVVGRDCPDAASLDETYQDARVQELTHERTLAAFAVLRRKYATATISRTRSTVAGFTFWLRRRGLIEDDPMEDVKFARTTVEAGMSMAVHAFTTEEVGRLTAAAGQPPGAVRSAWPARDSAIIEVGARCGLRATEIAMLQVRHIDRRFERPLLRLVSGTKGGKRRDVPIPSAVVGAIDAYLEERTGRLGPFTPAARCFVRLDGREIDRSFLDRLVRRLAAEGGVTVPHQSATHALRHHYGVQLAMRGVQVPVIQSLLGHSDSRTTAVYTRLVGSHLTEALDDAGWL